MMTASTFYDYRTSRSLVRARVLETPYPESDDQYDLCVCEYTGALISRNESIILGAIIPQAAISYLCHPLAVGSRNESIHAFNEMEQNCNTCQYLQRVDFDRKDWKSSGLMPGKCLNKHRKPLYPQGGDNILFSPEDCMSQSCYKQRD
jgi:hypothetical protein